MTFKIIFVRPYMADPYIFAVRFQLAYFVHKQERVAVGNIAHNMFFIVCYLRGKRKKLF